MTVDELSGAERRKNQRVKTDQQISFADLGQAERSAVATNVSSGGIRFETVGANIELGDVLRVTLRVGEDRFELTGKVVWVTGADSGTQDVGLEFSGLDPKFLRLLEDTAGSGLAPVEAD